MRIIRHTFTPLLPGHIGHFNLGLMKPPIVSIVPTMTDTPKRSHGPLIVLIIILLPVLFVGWQWWSLMRLQSAIDMQARTVAGEYNTILQKDLAPALASSSTAPTPAVQTALATIGGTSISTDGKSLSQVLDAIVHVQTGLTQLDRALTATDPMRLSAAYATLQKDAGNEQMNLLLLPYNVKVQDWNNRLDGSIGSLFARMLHLQHIQLLRPDGKVEFETQATF